MIAENAVKYAERSTLISTRFDRGPRQWDKRSAGPYEAASVLNRSSDIQTPSPRMAKLGERAGVGYLGGTEARPMCSVSLVKLRKLSRHALPGPSKGSTHRAMSQTCHFRIKPEQDWERLKEYSYARLATSTSSFHSMPTPGTSGICSTPPFI